MGGEGEEGNVKAALSNWKFKSDYKIAWLLGYI